ncbi:MAG TPA: hypothetical protein PKM08_00060 [Syntrophorhabdaceae bacterium]|jgi:hypothetical protein|nr:hypothetical protein [Syntrophorhabdaceae bacterium]HNT67964.1 hypothetical protein [Syntrophorhabdaceae bacterium]
MLIRIKTTVNIPEIPSEVEMETGTLRDLFKKVFGGTHFANDVIDPHTGDIDLDSLFDVRLNDVSYLALSQGLDTGLCDGDTVLLSLILLGGG